ncbi:MAG: phosphoglucosamine mutase, partial [Burkholderiales bacterium]
VLHALRAQGEPLVRLAASVRLYPQVLLNVRVKKGFDYKSDPAVQAALKATESSLKGKGRVLLRASGTEPVIRVMVEGEREDAISTLAQSRAEAIRNQAAA